VAQKKKAKVTFKIRKKKKSPPLSVLRVAPRGESLTGKPTRQKVLFPWQREKNRAAKSNGLSPRGPARSLMKNLRPQGQLTKKKKKVGNDNQQRKGLLWRREFGRLGKKKINEPARPSEWAVVRKTRKNLTISPRKPGERSTFRACEDVKLSQDWGEKRGENHQKKSRVKGKTLRAGVRDGKALPAQKVKLSERGLAVVS